jgi:phenylalanyl-tRNA synthetase beta chain
VHPAQSATLRVDGRAVGFAGALHPDEALRLDARDPVLVAELDLDALAPGAAVRTRPLPRFPAVERDLSLVVPEDAVAQDLESLVRGAAGPLLAAARLVARYAGAPIPAGKVSVTFTLVFQDPGRTLTGDEVQSAVDEVSAAARARGFEIRGV